jgi:hypothetical protein
VPSARSSAQGVCARGSPTTFATAWGSLRVSSIFVALAHGDVMQITGAPTPSRRPEKHGSYVRPPPLQRQASHRTDTSDPREHAPRTLRSTTTPRASSEPWKGVKTIFAVGAAATSSVATASLIMRPRGARPRVRRALRHGR